MRIPLDAERYERLHRAFVTCQGCTQEETKRVLAELRSSDSDLAQQLERMLNTEESAADVLDDARIDANDGPPAWIRPGPVTIGELPDAIDGLRVVRELGSGGMGVVYEAEQTSPHRRVAVKLIRPGLAHGERLRRFRLEAEAQARLKHPGIAQIHAFGTCDLGHGETPYLVMELVEGQPLLLHVAEARLDRRARLALVAELCDAVQHAHERNIVHRDLKPDNVLVDAEGRAKVLDFGVARVQESEAPLTTIHTAEGELVGTLTHMAPEQLAGDPAAVGPPADVYALGVIAFELLTGRLPHDVAGLPLTQAVRRLTEEEAPRLGRLDKALRGDVETLVGKALEREPARRYVSAAAFAADLRRLQEHRPITARRPSVVYRAARFARRHRGLCVGAALALVASAAGVLGVLRYAQRESEMRIEAERLGVDSRATAYATIDTLLSGGEEWKARTQLDRIPDALRGWEWAWLSARAPLRIPDTKGGYAFWGETSRLATLTNEHWADVFVHDFADPTAAPLLVEGLDGVRTGWGDCGILLKGRLRAREDWTATPFQGATGFLDVDHARYSCVLRHSSVGTDWDDAHAANLPTLIRPIGYHPGEDLLVLATDDSRIDALSEVEVIAAATSASGRVSQRYDVHYPNASRIKFDARAELALVTPYQQPPEGPVVVVRVEGWQELGRLEGPFEVSPALHPDGTEMACATQAGHVDVYGIPDLELLRSFQVEPTDGVYWTPDGTLVTSGFGALFLRDPVTGAVLEEVRTEHRDEHHHFHPNGRLVAAKGGDNDDVHVYELGAPAPAPYVELRGHGAWIYPCVFSPDGDLIASAAPHDPEVLVWDAWTGELLARLPRAIVPVPRRRWTNHYAPLFFTSDGGELVTTEPYGTSEIRLVRFDLLTGRAVQGPPRPAGGWEHAGGERLAELLDAFGTSDGTRMRKLDSKLVLHPDGGRLITASAEGALVRAPSGAEQRIDDAAVQGFAVSPDGSLLAIGSLREVRIVSLPDGDLVTRALESPGSDKNYYALAFSPDGSRLAVGDSNGILQLLETRHYRTIASFPNHDDYVYSLAWSPDGTRLVSSSGDTTLRLYDSVHPISRRLQAEQRSARVTRQTERLEALVRAGDDPAAAARKLCARAETPESLQAARRACLLRWAQETSER